MIRALYTLAIYFYYGGIRLLAFWSPKARQWVAGRRNLWSHLSTFRAKLDTKERVVWIHCASLGEFEQGRPVIEALRRQLPQVRIALSFFSPSGYEIRKDYDQADWVGYLPIDLPAQARRFITTLQPDVAIFVKYEFWYHHLHVLRQKGIPTLLVSALFRPGQLFFRPYGGWYRRLLFCFDHIFVQQEDSARLLSGIGYDDYTVAGDTRIDRVLALSRTAPSRPLIAQFAGAHPVWIAGSTWPADEKLLLPFWGRHLPDDWRIILAPHEIAEAHIQEIERTAPIPTIRYSRAQAHPAELAEARLLLIDNIGMLSSLYRYGRLAYIGGGFGKAIHNILEPMAFGLPVLFGPRHEKFQEAVALVSRGGGFVVEDATGLRRAFDRLQHHDIYQEASQSTIAYLQEHQGSTGRVLAYILQKGWLSAPP